MPRATLLIFFTRVAAYSPATVNLQCYTAPEARAYPKGGWEYHSGMRLLQSTRKRPLRVFVANNEFDIAIQSS